MTVQVEPSPDTVPADGRDERARDERAEATVHALLLRMAGFLPDRLLAEAYGWLAAGRRLDVAQAVAFEAVSQPLQLGADEIELLRTELTRAGADSDLVVALEELRGQRQPGPWLFVSALPTTPADATLVVRPLDLTGVPHEHLDAVDQAVVAEASAVPGVTAVWRAWRMPPNARPWHEPVRVVVVSVDDPVDSLSALTVRLHQAMATAGDTEARAEVCWAGLDAPFYQTLARSCGALLWANRQAVPVTTAPVFDGVDPDRGPWFTTNRPVVTDDAERDRLLTALRTAEIITWSGTWMVDVLNPERGDVVPLHLRTDGRWVWSDAVAYYLEQYGLAPDPDLVAHLSASGPAQPLDEVGLHRALVHLLSRQFDDVAWQVPPPGRSAVTP